MTIENGFYESFKLKLCQKFINFWDNDEVILSIRIFHRHPSFKKKPLMVIWLMSDGSTTKPFIMSLVGWWSTLPDFHSHHSSGHQRSVVSTLLSLRARNIPSTSKRKTRETRRENAVLGLATNVT